MKNEIADAIRAAFAGPHATNYLEYIAVALGSHSVHGNGPSLPIPEAIAQAGRELAESNREIAQAGLEIASAISDLAEAVRRLK